MCPIRFSNTSRKLIQCLWLCKRLFEVDSGSGSQAAISEITLKMLACIAYAISHPVEADSVVPLNKQHAIMKPNVQYHIHMTNHR